MRKLFIMLAFAMLTTTIAQASFMEVVNTINATGRAINSINSAARGTMSTVEYGQRFQDRQQDRQDYKRVQKGYNETAQEEYYKTLQETKMLEQQYQENQMLRVDL
jgi:sensor histidine kinase YesM